MHMDICFLYIRNGGFMVMAMVNEICKQGLPDHTILVRDQLIFSKGIYIMLTLNILFPNAREISDSSFCCFEGLVFLRFLSKHVVYLLNSFIFEPLPILKSFFEDVMFWFRWINIYLHTSKIWQPLKPCDPVEFCGYLVLLKLLYR